MDDARDLPADWRQQARQLGKAQFIRQEMIRLGFWAEAEEVDPGDSEAVEKSRLRAEAIEERMRVAEALAPLEARLAEIDRELAASTDISALLAQARRERIERVRAAREARKAERARERAEHLQRDRAWRARTLPYLGHGVSGGLQYRGGDDARLASNGLPKFETAEEIAEAMGITPGELAWLTYHRVATPVDHYVRFTIPKKHGGLRIVSAPKTRMRAAQRWLLDEVLANVALNDAAVAFRPGASTVLNAEIHAGAAVVIRVDFEDFFPSITFPRVKGLFMALGYNEGVATIFALLATEAPRVVMTLDGEMRHVAIGKRQLPQGAACSPALTNVLCRSLDRRLAGLAWKFGFAYSRYADDMVFSSRNADAPVGQLLGGVRRVTAEEGFRIQEDKTRVMRSSGRQTVTGIVVNDGELRVSRKDIRRFRAFLHSCARDGLEAVSERIGKDARDYAVGYVAYLSMVNPVQAIRFQQEHPWLDTRHNT